jgi:hypothetical protein
MEMGHYREKLVSLAEDAVKAITTPPWCDLNGLDGMLLPDRTPILHRLPPLLASLLCAISALSRAQASPTPFVENDGLYMFVRLNTPDQMAAFYEARGFPDNAIERLRRTCFVMAHIENRGDEVIWLELKNWHFLTRQGEVQRLDRNDWERVWDEIGLPQASRSTFGWTQLPGERDLQPGEPVGGNVILPVTDDPFTLQADFLTGKDRRAGMISVRLENLRCAKDQPAP